MGGSESALGDLDVSALTVEAAEVGRAGHPRGSSPEQGYGTAGFRTVAETLDHVMYRMGILAALRSKALEGKAVGVMVTASHNPERDNGVKLVEPLGEMLPIEWEAHASALANAADEDLSEVIAQLVKTLDIRMGTKAEVIVGRDTRKSSPGLSMAVCDGVGVMQPASARSLGLTTTPQLHYVVRCENCPTYGSPSLKGYADKMLGKYKALVKDVSPCQQYKAQVIADCANGVGGIALRSITPRLQSILGIELRNDGQGALNEGCGADYVKIKQAPPSCVDLADGQRYLSIDGDADRLVYFFSDGGVFRLLDGDRIALLMVHFLAKLLKEASLEDICLGLVQTAYANGGSTRYAVERLGQENVVCAKTGVKHCHHAAKDMDIGVYFEANGHGTVLFSEKFVKQATAAKNDGYTRGVAASQLLQLRDIINEAVGDAISGILAVEAILQRLDWSCPSWYNMYSDLPNRQIKVKVADRSIFETTNAERTCVKPEGLQAKIDALVEKQAALQGRAFVRPSGTEDVVRVYAEAQTLDATLALGQEVVDAVYALAGGVGEKPQVT